MRRDVKALPVTTTVREIVEVLSDGLHAHNGFAVVDSVEMYVDGAKNHSYMKFRGLILRVHLLAILSNRLFEGDEEEELQAATKFTPTAWRMLCDREDIPDVKEV